MPIHRRLAVYCRVSTLGQTIEPQLFSLRQYAAARGLVIAAEYSDCGISGEKARRPGLDRMLADTRRGRFNA